MSQTYQQIRAIRDRASCVPTALALVTGIDYEVVNAHLIKKGYRRPNIGVLEADWMRAPGELGFQMIPYPVTAKTVRTIARELPIGRKFLVQVSRHLLAFTHGEIQDWTDGRLHKIKRVYEIIPTGDQQFAPAPVVAAPKAPRVPNTDPIAALLNGRDLIEVYAICGFLLQGETPSGLKARYAHLNPGQQRMCCGNRLRAAHKKGLCRLSDWT